VRADNRDMSASGSMSWQSDERRFPWTYTLLELLPAGGWLGLAGAF
jgi:hypothetical protein